MKKLFFVCMAAMALCACGGSKKEDKAKEEVEEAIEAVKEAAEE